MSRRTSRTQQNDGPIFPNPANWSVFKRSGKITDQEVAVVKQLVELNPQLRELPQFSIEGLILGYRAYKRKNFDLLVDTGQLDLGFKIVGVGHVGTEIVKSNPNIPDLTRISQINRWLEIS
jgi:hypothetical protein